MLANPAAKAPRAAAPAPLLVVPIPVLGNILTTTTFPGGVVPGARGGASTGAVVVPEPALVCPEPA